VRDLSLSVRSVRFNAHAGHKGRRFFRLPRPGRGGFLAGFVTFYGLALDGALVLLPMEQVDSLGLKRCGSVADLAGFFQTVGASVGPIGTGRIFDLMGGYTLAFRGVSLHGSDGRRGKADVSAARNRAGSPSPRRHHRRLAQSRLG
jgi:hypothetical protein